MELTRQEKTDALKKWLAKTFVDPVVTKQTLGEELSSVSARTLLVSSAKLIKINKKEIEPDDRDNLRYSTFLGLEDFIKDHIEKDAGGLRKKAAFKSQQRKNLTWLTSSFFTPQIKSVIIGNSLSNNVDGINPMEHFDNAHRVTKMGEGGIASSESIPDECYDKDTEVFTSTGWMNWSRVTSETRLACQIDGRLEYHVPNKLMTSEYTGKMYGIRTRTLDLLVTPNHRMWTRKYRGGSSARAGVASWGFELATDGFNRPREFMISHKAYLGKKKGVGSDLAALVGWYVAEGSASEAHHSFFVITQCPTANPEKVGAIEKLLRTLGLNAKRYGKNIFVRDRKLRDYLVKNCGMGSENKKLPDACFDWPIEEREQLLAALLAGDGHTHENGHAVYHTVSPRLADQVVQLAISLGKASRRCKDYDRDDGVRWPSLSCSILTSTVQGVTGGPRAYKTNYYTCDYSGMIFCAEVPGGLLLVRRNGAVPVWSGNSRQINTSSFGFFDPLHIAESDKVGVTQYIAANTIKGKDNKLYKLVKDKEGKTKWVDHETILNSRVKIPEV